MAHEKSPFLDSASDESFNSLTKGAAQLYTRSPVAYVWLRCKNHLGCKNTERYFSLGGNIKEIGHESNLSANVAYPDSSNLSLPDRVHGLITADGPSRRLETEEGESGIDSAFYESAPLLDDILPTMEVRNLDFAERLRLVQGSLSSANRQNKSRRRERRRRILTVCGHRYSNHFRPAYSLCVSLRRPPQHRAEFTARPFLFSGAVVAQGRAGLGVASNSLVTRSAFFESLFRTYTFALL
jgi:hypothetical protein